MPINSEGTAPGSSRGKDSGSEPLVSVVTPFYNTREFLAECIESVLRQNYQNWEYILVDNCSTDGSGEIAQEYASRCSEKIQLVRTKSFLTQVQNYNFALSCISPDSKYCKMVQADDWIYPECLERMVALAETNPSVGIVSSYYLNGNRVEGCGLPVLNSCCAHRTVLPGKEMARLFLRTGTYVFGTPTTVMYKSSTVRSQQCFYDESLLHEDTEKCMQILEHWDFGFVHQVLSFLRTHDKSITAASRHLQPVALDWYIIVQRYAAVFLGKGEAEALKRQSKQHYYEVLAHEALCFRGVHFWRRHKAGLKTLDQNLDWVYLLMQSGGILLSLLCNPGSTMMRAIRFLKSNNQENVGT